MFTVMKEMVVVMDVCGARESANQREITFRSLANGDKLVVIAVESTSVVANLLSFQ